MSSKFAYIEVLLCCIVSSCHFWKYLPAAFHPLSRYWLIFLKGIIHSFFIIKERNIEVILFVFQIEKNWFYYSFYTCDENKA
jgi:hypothetical protein